MSQPFDPYAAPQAAAPAQAIYAGQGQSFSWEPGEVLGLAWERFKRYWFVVVAGYFVVTLIDQVATQGPLLASRVLSNGADRQATGAFVAIAGAAVGGAVNAFFMVGLFRVWLDAARGRTPSFGTFFLGGDRFLPMFGLYLLMILAIVGGFLLLIVPGFILAFGLSFAPFYLVDDPNLGPLGAMKASWTATKGHKGKLFALGFLCWLIAIPGLLACGIGILASVSIAYMAWAIVFTRVSGRDAALPDPAPGMLR